MLASDTPLGRPFRSNPFSRTIRRDLRSRSEHVTDHVACHTECGSRHGYAPDPEVVAGAIVDCVEHRLRGLVVMPPTGWFRTAMPDPAQLRHTMRRMLGIL
ncbi:hypothetical protein ACQP0C_14465 [Nocardia sp. CA-129566]|uniref:hypothetical protein n=1 Tax=Nocardia sp. CA-129566 TaxID=3239976 RepID=UPI003D9633E9